MVANVLTHKSKPWSEVLHHWQVRLLMGIGGISMGEVKIKLDDRYPRLAIVMSERPLNDDELEHAFRNSPNEMDHLRLDIFPNCPEDFEDNELFDAVAENLNVAPVG